MKKIVLLVAFCLGIGSAFAQDIEKLKADGDAALNAKNYTEALAKYGEYLKLTEYKDTVRIFNCGFCANQAKKYAEAEAASALAEAKSYADTAETDAVASAKTYTDNQIKNVNSTNTGLTSRVDAITGSSVANANGVIETISFTDEDKITATRKLITMNDMSDSATFVFYCGTASELTENI